MKKHPIRKTKIIDTTDMPDWCISDIVKECPSKIKKIVNPSEAVQLAAVNHMHVAIFYIENPFVSVIERVCKHFNEHPGAVQLQRGMPEYLQQYIFKNYPHLVKFLQEAFITDPKILAFKKLAF